MGKVWNESVGLSLRYEVRDRVQGEGEVTLGWNVGLQGLGSC